MAAAGKRPKPYQPRVDDGRAVIATQHYATRVKPKNEPSVTDGEFGVQLAYSAVLAAGYEIRGHHQMRDLKPNAKWRELNVEEVGGAVASKVTVMIRGTRKSLADIAASIIVKRAVAGAEVVNGV